MRYSELASVMKCPYYIKVDENIYKTLAYLCYYKGEANYRTYFLDKDLDLKINGTYNIQNPIWDKLKEASDGIFDIRLFFNNYTVTYIDYECFIDGIVIGLLAE